MFLLLAQSRLFSLVAAFRQSIFGMLRWHDESSDCLHSCYGCWDKRVSFCNEHRWRMGYQLSVVQPRLHYPHFQSPILMPKVELWKALFTTQTALAVARHHLLRVKYILQLIFKEVTAVALTETETKELWSGVIAALGNGLQLLLCWRWGPEVYS